MSAGPRLTLQDFVRDKVISLTMLLGVTLSAYLKSQLASSGGSGMALLELALICVAVIYLLRATNVLAAQVAIVIEHGANSGMWSRATARLAQAGACLLQILRAALRVAVAVLMIAIPVLVLFAVLTFLDSLLLDNPWRPRSWPVLLPFESAIAIAAVVGLIVGTWFIRGISYLLQARCHTMFV
jgi:hypothetical protein